MFKLARSRRGISPILATLLLIVIAVAAVIVTYAWVLTFTGTQTTAAGKMIKFDSAVINAASDQAIVYIRNSGSEVVTIDKIYVDGTDYTSSATGLPATLDIESTSTVTLNGTLAGLDFSPGSRYRVRITGPGVTWEESVKAS